MMSKIDEKIEILEAEIMLVNASIKKICKDLQKSMDKNDPWNEAENIADYAKSLERSVKNLKKYEEMKLMLESLKK